MTTGKQDGWQLNLITFWVEDVAIDVVYVRWDFSFDECVCHYETTVKVRYPIYN